MDHYDKDGDKALSGNELKEFLKSWDDEEDYSTDEAAIQWLRDQGIKEGDKMTFEWFDANYQ